MSTSDEERPQGARTRCSVVEAPHRTQTDVGAKGCVYNQRDTHPGPAERKDTHTHTHKHLGGQAEEAEREIHGGRVGISARKRVVKPKGVQYDTIVRCRLFDTACSMGEQRMTKTNLPRVSLSNNLLALS